MRKRTLAIVIAAILVLLIALVQRLRLSESDTIVLDPKDLYVPRELEIPPADTRTPESRAQVPIAAALDPSLPSVQPETATQAIEVEGQVLEAGSLLPLDGYTVTFSSHRNHDTKKSPTVKALTDSRGRFHAALEGSEWSRDEVCPVEIRDRAQTNVYLGVVALRSEHTFLVEPTVHAHGRLVVNRELDFSKMRLRISESHDFDTGVRFFCTDLGLESDGQFRTSFVPRHRTDRFLLSFTYQNLPIHVAEAAAADLTSDEGATVRCSLAEVRLTIVDEASRPVEGAEARVQSHGLVRADDGWRSLSDGNGRVEFLLEDGTLEFCVGKRGHAPELFQCTVPSSGQTVDRTVVLAALREEDEITGSVLSPRDAPVHNAVVTAEPRTDHVGIGPAGYVQTRTDDRGRFRLPVRSGSEIALFAYHKDYGRTPDFPIIARRAPIELRFEALGALELHLRGALPGTTTLAEPIEYGLLDERRDRRFVGSENRAPFVIEELPAGEYLAVVRLNGSSAYGSARVRVEGGTTQRVDIVLVPSSTFVGSVVRASGRTAPDIVATLHHPLWMNELEAWGRSRTGSDGRFAIFGGDLARGELSFSEGSDTVARTQALEGVPVLVRIDG